MKHSYLKHFFVLLLGLSPMMVWADEWKDPKTNVIYTFTPGESVASVKAGGWPIAGSPDATGDIAILSEITVDGAQYAVTSIGNLAFWCVWLTSINIPEGVTSIGESAFSCCGLTSINIPKSVTEIGTAAFSDCHSLTSVNIPEGVTSIGTSTFFRCNSLISINIPKSVTSIGESSFYECSSLTSINIPEGVTSIGESSFYECSSLTSINIPEGVTNIGNWAFFGCSSLTSINIPNNVTSIGDYAFNNCSGLTSINVEAGNPKYDSRNNCNAIIETESNTLIAGCQNTTIPNSMTTIGSRAFFGCSSLTSINIPNNVTSIDEFAFWGCSSLTSITIPSSVTSIDYGAFGDCRSLTSVTIPNSMTRIGSSAFDGTAWYNDQPDGLVYIGNMAYRYKGTMPENTAIIIKDGSKTINEGAFIYFENLTSVTIPNSVKSIGAYAFKNCSGLTSVTSYITNPFPINLDVFMNEYWDEGTFEEKFTTATLYVPQGTKSFYEATEGWKEFQNIVEIDMSGVDVAEGGEPRATSTYHLSGHLLASPQRGVNILRMSDGTTRKVLVK